MLRVLMSVVVVAFALSDSVLANADAAGEARPADVARAEPPDAVEAAPDEAQQTRIPLRAAPNAQPDAFPLPIWRNARFSDVAHLAGVLLRTPKGTVQIKQLQWGSTEDGEIYICHLVGYTRKGGSVVFGSPEACKPQISKENFLGTAFTWSDAFLQSFDFGTDHEGYLVLVDWVIELGSTTTGTGCDWVDVAACVSEGCSGLCGTPVGTTEPPEGVNGLGAGVAPEPIDCTCNGQSGSCVFEIRRRCGGECPEQQSCRAARGPSGVSCDCFQQ